MMPISLRSFITWRMLCSFLNMLYGGNASHVQKRAWSKRSLFNILWIAGIS